MSPSAAISGSHIDDVQSERENALRCDKRQRQSPLAIFPDRSMYCRSEKRKLARHPCTSTNLSIALSPASFRHEPREAGSCRSFTGQNGFSACSRFTASWEMLVSKIRSALTFFSI